MLTCVYYSYLSLFKQLLVLNELRTVKTSWFTSRLDSFNVTVRYSLVSLNQESTIFFWFSQYIQVWSLSRWRHFTNGSEMRAANLDSWGPRETAIKHYKFTTTVYLKNIIIWCRYCAPICTESTSFCEHNFGNQEHNLAKFRALLVA